VDAALGELREWRVIRPNPLVSGRFSRPTAKQ